MPLPKKYNFIPEHQLNTVGEPTEYSVTINKIMNLYLSPFIVKMWGLDKKVVRFYVDVPNKSIAWTEVTGGDLSTLKNVRQMNINKENGNVTLSISKMLKQLSVTKDMLPFKHIPVTTYKDSLIEGDLKVMDLRPYFKV